MRNILVTGGTGFIGSALVKELINRRYNVRVFDNNYRGNIDNLQSCKKQIDFIEGDIRNPSDVKKAVADIDTVFHLAFINGTENFYKYPGLVLDVGLRGHLNIMDACKEASIETFIYASSSEIYQTPPTIPTPENVPGLIPDIRNPRYSYGSTKLIGEMLTLHYAPEAKMRKIIFRPHNFYGPSMGFEHIIPQIIKKIFRSSNNLKNRKAKIEIQGTGEETRAFCFIDDAIDAILTISEKGQDEDIFHLGVNIETKIIDIIKMIGTSMDIELSLESASLQKGSTQRRCPDVSKLTALGYKPKISLESGLKKTVNWYKKYYMEKKGIS